MFEVNAAGVVCGLGCRFNNYMLMLAQWPFFQSDPSKPDIVDGTARYVDEADLLLQRRPIKLDSDEHAEAMHRVVVKNNQQPGWWQGCSSSCKQP